MERVLREAAAETLREAPRAASVHDIVRLKEAAGAYARLVGCQYAAAAALMLKPSERGTSRRRVWRQRGVEHLAAEVRWTAERAEAERPAEEGEGTCARGAMVA
jgi:hypothetical protein